MQQAWNPRHGPICSALLNPAQADNADACADGKLHQEPAPELKSLRQGDASTVDRVEAQPEQGVAVAGTRAAAYDLSLRLHRGSTASSGTPQLVSISGSSRWSVCLGTKHLPG